LEKELLGKRKRLPITVSTAHYCKCGTPASHVVVIKVGSQALTGILGREKKLGESAARPKVSWKFII